MATSAGPSEVRDRVDQHTSAPLPLNYGGIFLVFKRILFIEIPDGVLYHKLFLLLAL